MALRVSVEVQVKAGVRALARVRSKGVFAAQRNTMNKGADLLLDALQRQWSADMDVRRRSFPRRVLRKRGAFVNFTTGALRRPAAVVSIAADEILDLQIRGGVKRPRGRAFLVPENRRARRTKRRTYRAGDYIFSMRRGQDRYVGALAARVRVPRRWRIARAVRRVERLLPRVALRELRRELRSAQARP